LRVFSGKLKKNRLKASIERSRTLEYDPESAPREVEFQPVRDPKKYLAYAARPWMAAGMC
jgi:hypothetical protein